MNLSAPFIRRPIATVLLTIGLALSGVAGYLVLPVAPLPMVDFPAIGVQANLPGASPDTMAISVATPLERRLGVIAGVNEITSQSSTGSTRISLQFDISKNIDGAAREVQAAINAARVDLPATLRSNPTYRKANPAAAPVIILALTSDTKTPGQIYDAVNNIVQQRLSQVTGVGDVEIGGGSQPAVRVEVSPFALNRFGVSLEDVRAAIQSANANRPKGVVQDQGGRRLQIYTSTGGTKAADYAPLIIAYRNGAAVRLQDVAQVTDSVQDTRTIGLYNGKPSIVVLITQQPSANVIAMVDSVRAALPLLQAQLPSDVKMQVASDSTTSIRASLREIEITLAIAIILVVLVVSAFLRRWKATLIPAVATVVSLMGTFGIMYLLGFSLNNLSLMALTVASGFVVDDAIVVLENTNRHIENGMGRFEAALAGARQVGFTVLSMSISLVAVFIPLLFMGGQVGRLFREFAVTLSAAVLISLAVSLTTTPMMCAYLLRSKEEEKPEGAISRAFGKGFERLHRVYEHSLDFALSARPLMMLVLAAIIGLNVYLYMAIPKGFFPIQDSGRLNGGLRADQSISSEEMGRKMKQLVAILMKDPAVDHVVGFTGGGRSGGGFLSVDLKPRGQRKEGGQAVITRLRPQLAKVTGLTVFLNPQQDVRAGGRQTNATYQYTLKADNAQDLKTWAQKLNDAMATHTDVLTDVNTDQQDNGVESYVDVDHDTAARLGVNLRDVDNALYDSFGQRQVANIYEDLNQYTVVMETAPMYSLSPDALANVYVPASGSITAPTTPAQTAARQSAAAVAAANAAATQASLSTTAPSSAAAGAATGASGTTASSSANPGARDPSTGSPLNTAVRRMVPLSAIAHFYNRSTPAAINHQDAELATTVSFNLAPGASLSDAQTAISEAEADIGMPTNVRGSFQGTAKSFTDSLKQEPVLILAALIAIYIVLGVLYESLVHPITVLSTLPSAGVGALLMLMVFKMEFSIIALIGIFLLIGLVKKNAILIIDFALDAQRSRGLSAVEAIREACLLRFRPILMTTMAAGLGALPLAIGFGEGSELRQPLGVAIIGGLIASQLLTLLTTPVVYVYIDRWRRRRDERFLSRNSVEGQALPA
ncbi:MAG TPA: efflux RND transporter permease subunit [Phenylobacterium sp.]|jgi:multidrug efflux pump|uniref:efflux RND transporter permease subunit n=1 Tax=Phenylobacterium sp. TaxID=1871053 RepID=UPI002C69D784|nr:efflux RND transporter permease subunit [Phenylobacterium sp.]HXA40731.1 efflux RND transporter permease subunit [Phenylobacterium sp.]